MIKYLSIKHLDEAYVLFNLYSKEVGFISKPVIRSAISRAEIVGVFKNNELIGVMHFHDRKDNITTIYEIVVHKTHRGKGIGKQLINWLAMQSYCIRLKCPSDNISNGFYNKLGFKKISCESGRKRSLNIWTLKCDN